MSKTLFFVDAFTAQPLPIHSQAITLISGELHV